ncbi:MAG TPA: ABC transporter permease [Blastocatellia bacterium]|nr:ABC transporter permease [Blastocatellia bacterium]
MTSNRRPEAEGGRTQVRRGGPWVARFVSVTVVAVAWEFFGRLAPLFASYPSAITQAFVQLTFVEHSLIPALITTLQGFAVGYVVAAVLGVVIGFAMGRVRLIEIVMDPYISALYATPRIAMIPLLVLWVGVGFKLRVTIVVLSAIFPIIVNTFIGARKVGDDYLDTGRAFAATEWQLLRTIVFPAALPYVFAGFRIGIARALVGITVAEMTAAITGTGALLIAFGRLFATDRVFVPVIVIGLLSIALTEIVSLAQRRVMPWTRVRREA